MLESIEQEAVLWESMYKEPSPDPVSEPEIEEYAPLPLIPPFKDMGKVEELEEAMSSFHSDIISALKTHIPTNLVSSLHAFTLAPSLIQLLEEISQIKSLHLIPKDPDSDTSDSESSGISDSSEEETMKEIEEKSEENDSEEEMGEEILKQELERKVKELEKIKQ